MHRRIVRSTAPLAFALLFLAPAALGASGREGPTQGACDATGYFVCAGADAGAQATCVLDSPTSAACSWSYGYIWSGSSPLALPGEAKATTTATWQICRNAACVSIPLEYGNATCAWNPFMPCVENSSQSGSLAGYRLALGDCRTVTVTDTIAVHAAVPRATPALASADWSTGARGAGEVCLVDNGR
ncbi:MAG: hypothetical protein ACYDCK_10260 [Thermoplasmatota archaeon]